MELCYFEFSFIPQATKLWYIHSFGRDLDWRSREKLERSVFGRFVETNPSREKRENCDREV